MDRKSNFPQRSLTNFPLELTRYLESLVWSKEYDFLYYHQNVARIYARDPNVHGLLIYHGTGIGKSMLAVSIAMDELFPPSGVVANAAHHPRQIIMLLAKSLAANMQKEILGYIRARKARRDNETHRSETVAPDDGYAGAGYVAGAARKRETINGATFDVVAELPEEKQKQWIEDTFSFVSMNASNMLQQMARASKGRSSAAINDVDDITTSVMDRKLEQMMNVGNLDNKLLIVDEAHNLFRAITNGSQNGFGIYDMIMRAKNLTTIFLSGTPIASDPFETVVCFNMLARERVLPTIYEDFYNIFVGTDSLKNRNKFQNRIFGLVSFADYGSIGALGNGGAAGPLTAIKESTATADEPIENAKTAADKLATNVDSTDTGGVEFPTEYPVEEIRVQMTTDQYGAYEQARETERQDLRRGSSVENDHRYPIMDRYGARAPMGRPAMPLQKPKGEMSSSYRVHSRQISNYCPPEEVRLQIRLANDPIPNSLILAKIGKIISPKFSAILDRITGKHNGQLGLVYSQFVGIGGLSALARFIDQNGYEGRYAMITGDVDPEERDAIRNRFNAPENAHGENIALLLVSSTGAEGLDLKNVRHVHILEPYWNYGRIKQVKARAVRNRSHIGLPPAERDVHVYVYIAVPPTFDASRETIVSDVDAKYQKKLMYVDTHSRNEVRELTSDEELYANSIKNQRIVESFESAIKETAIECELMRKRGIASHSSAARMICRVCAPTGQKLYTDNVEHDIQMTDPCTPIESKKVQVQSIKIGDTTFFWKPATAGSIIGEAYGYEIFIYDDRIRAHRPLPLNDVRYAAVVEAIKSKK